MNNFYGKSLIFYLTRKAVTKQVILIITLFIVGQKIFGQSATFTSQNLLFINEGCIEIAPKYPGGHKAMARLFANNVKYLKTTKGQYQNGEVVITFKVDTLGNTTDIKVAKSFRANFDQEATRLIGLLKGWTPATINGKKTAYYLSQPLVFRTEKTSKIQPYTCRKCPIRY